MEIHNNNRAVEKELATAYYKKDRQKNIIMSVAIGMSVLLLYAAFAIADGKVRSDYLTDIRGMGTTANVSLQNGSKKQYEQMQKLSYLDAVGIEKDAMNVYTADGIRQELVYVDETAFDKMLSPAYTDICGEYPENVDEIMASETVLEQYGITDPKIGQDVDMELEMPDGTKVKRQFKVSGFYRDYIDISINVPRIYVSEAFLQESDISLFPADKIIARQGTVESGAQIEQWVYSDIDMEYDSQQVYGENPMIMQKINGTFGSLPVAVSCAVIVVLCAFMLIYNVSSIAMARDIQQYGMLKVIGTTNKQLKRIAFRNNMKNTLRGICVGAAVGGIAVKIFVPYVLQALFMRGLGKSDVTGFYAGYMMLSVLIVFITSFMAESAAVRHVTKKSAIEAIRYTVADQTISKRNKRKISQKTNDSISLSGIAWRNVTRSKRKLAVSMLSILIGMIMALGSNVIMTGTDITNELEQNPDFEVGILTGVFRYPDKIPQEINDDTPVMTDEMIDDILSIDGIAADTIDKTCGSYAVIRLDQDEALAPRLESIGDDAGTSAFATLQIVDDAYVDQLAQYVKDEKYTADIDTLRQGEGCILLHHHEMSQILQQKADDEIRNPIHFYSLAAYADPKFDYLDQQNIQDYGKGSLKCCGYLDFTDENFPKLQTTSMGNNINYFIMTKKAFDRLGLPEKIFDISFDSVKNKDTGINQKLSQIVQNENEKSADMDTYYLNANYLLLDSEQSRINAARLMLGALAFVISMIGIMNYANTLLSEYASRKCEFAIMQSIGLDRRQLWKMVFLEGCFFSMIAIMGLIFVGSPVIWGLGAAIKKKLVYFKFIYPWKLLIILSIMLFTINLIIAVEMYRKSQDFTKIRGNYE